MKYCYFYFRSEEVTCTMPQSEPGELYEVEGSKPHRALRQLKETIRTHGYEPFEYFPRWDPNRRQLVGLDAFGRRVEQDLLDSIADEFGHESVAEERSPFRAMSAQMESFVQERVDRFVDGPRQEELNSLNRFISKPQGLATMLVTGAAGSGKSALLARLVAGIIQENPSITILDHFVGAAAGSTELRKMLQRFCVDLGVSADDLPTDVSELVSCWWQALKEAADSGPVVVVIDALNQMDEGDGAWAMHWLPRDLPEGVHVVVSGLPHATLTALRADGRRLTELKLRVLDRCDSREMLSARLLRYRKRLSEEQVDSLLAKPASGNPLYLITAAEELRTLGRHEQITDRIRALPGRVKDLFRWILVERLSRDVGFADGEGRPCGAQLVECFCGVLSASRFGLSHAELVALCDPGDPRGNVAALERLLRPYLMYRDELLDFYHSQLHEAAVEAYANGEERRRFWHRMLADYFETCTRTSNGSWDAGKGRAVFELAYHLAMAGLTNRLDALVEDESYRFALQEAFPEDFDCWPQVLRWALEASLRAEDPGTATRHIVRHARHVDASSRDVLQDARRRRIARALSAAKLDAPDRRALWYLLIAWERLAAGELDVAKTIVARVFDTNRFDPNQVRIPFGGICFAELVGCLLPEQAKPCIALVGNAEIGRLHQRALAERHFELALALADAHECGDVLLLAKAEAHLACAEQQGIERSQADLEAVARLLSVMPDEKRDDHVLAQRVAWCWLKSGDSRRAYQVAAEFFLGGDDGYILLKATVAQWLTEAGRIDLADKLLERAKNRFKFLGDDERTARCWTGLAKIGRVAAKMGRGEEAYDCLSRAFEALCRGSFFGDFNQAESVADVLRDLDDVGLSTRIPQLVAPRLAEVHAEWLREDDDQEGASPESPYRRALQVVFLPEALLEIGKPTEALRWVERVLEWNDRGTAGSDRGECLTKAAQLLERLGQESKARVVLQNAFDELFNSDESLFVSGKRLRVAEIYGTLGDVDRVRKVLSAETVATFSETKGIRLTVEKCCRTFIAQEDTAAARDVIAWWLQESRRGDSERLAGEGHQQEDAESTLRDRALEQIVDVQCGAGLIDAATETCRQSGITCRAMLAHSETAVALARVGRFDEATKLIDPSWPACYGGPVHAAVAAVHAQCGAMEEAWESFRMACDRLLPDPRRVCLGNLVAVVEGLGKIAFAGSIEALIKVALCNALDDSGLSSDKDTIVAGVAESLARQGHRELARDLCRLEFGLVSNWSSTDQKKVAPITSTLAESGDFASAIWMALNAGRQALDNHVFAGWRTGEAEYRPPEAIASMLANIARVQGAWPDRRFRVNVDKPPWIRPFVPIMRRLAATEGAFDGLEAAFEVAARIRNRIQNHGVSVYCTIAETAARNGQREQCARARAFAHKVFGEIFSAHDGDTLSIGDGWQIAAWSESARYIAELEVCLSQPDRGIEILSRTISTLNELGGQVWNTPSLMAELAISAHTLGLDVDTLKVLEDAEAMADGHRQRESFLREVWCYNHAVFAWAYAAIGDSEKGAGHLDSIMRDQVRDIALAAVCRELALADELERVRQLIDGCRHGHGVKAMCSVAAAVRDPNMAQQWIDRAEATAENIDDPQAEADAWSDIAVARARATDDVRQAAAATLSAADCWARLDNGHDMTQRMARGEAYAALGDRETARSLLAEVADQLPTQEVAAAQARSGLVEDAVMTVYSILIDQPSAAAHVAATLIDAGCGVQANGLLVLASSRLATAYEACGLLARRWPQRSMKIVAALRDI